MRHEHGSYVQAGHAWNCLLSVNHNMYNYDDGTCGLIGVPIATEVHGYIALIAIGMEGRFHPTSYHRRESPKAKLPK